MLHVINVIHNGGDLFWHMHHMRYMFDTFGMLLCFKQPEPKIELKL